MSFKVPMKHSNRIRELAQRWDISPNVVLDDILEHALGFYKYEFKNAGLKWTKEDKQKLVRLFLNNEPYEKISTAMQRTKCAVMSRLNKMGYLEFNPVTYQYTKTGKTTCL